MNTHIVDSVQLFKPRYFNRDHRAGNFVNQTAKRRVLLWWTPNHRKRPDRVFAMEHFLHFHIGEIVCQTVVTEMITKWAFGFGLIWIHCSDKTEICLGGDLVASPFFEPKISAG